MHFLLHILAGVRHAAFHRVLPLAWAAALVSSPILAGAQANVVRPRCSERLIDTRSFEVCDFTDSVLPALHIAPAPDPASRNWNFQRLDSALRTTGQHLVFATNAGIFGENGRPLGLLVVDGHIVQPLNSSPGPTLPSGEDVCNVANFYCPPNGVFYVADGHGGIAPTPDMVARGVDGLSLATQSGPLLVLHGRLAREFPASWRRRIVRNAACIRSDGTASFVLASDQTHGSFAAALRDSLQCRDALFLDGHISAMYTGTGAVPATRDFGAILYVAAPLAAGDTMPPPRIASYSWPFSTLTLRVGQARVRTLDELHQSYPGGTGIDVEATTPSPFGIVGLAANRVLLNGATADHAATHAATIAVDWQAPAHVSRGVSLRAGGRVGYFDMQSNEPSATPSNQSGTHEMLIGPAAALDIGLARLGVTIGGGVLLVPSTGRMHSRYLSLLGTYTVGTRWLRRILR